MPTKTVLSSSGFIPKEQPCRASKLSDSLVANLAMAADDIFTSVPDKLPSLRNVEMFRLEDKLRPANIHFIEFFPISEIRRE